MAKAENNDGSGRIQVGPRKWFYRIDVDDAEERTTFFFLELPLDETF